MTGVWLRQPALAAVSVAVGVVARRVDLAVCGAVLMLLGAVLGDRAWHEVEPDRLGPYRGWATVAEDPRRLGSGLRVVLEIEGERFDSFVFGSARRRLERREAGDRVAIVGVREELSGRFPRRAQVRHVVGELEVERVWSWSEGVPLARATNRLRGQLRQGAVAVMTADDAALFTGLVIGDDSRQPADMVADFRAAGLTHLTAVSGQNVALVLALLGPWLRRLRTWWRLGATLAVIGWFAVITRLEPSVLRASGMAALAALAFALGRDRSTVRILFLTIAVLVGIDPLLVWSVGFWLSVGATVGVVVIAPLLQPRLAGPRWWSNALAVTLGAQFGVLLPSWLVFERMPVLGIPANLLAVPVAGLVMLYGMPAALAASLLPPPVAVVVMAPATLGTKWVANVAEHAAAIRPTGAATAALWLAQLAGLVALVCPRHQRAEVRTL